MRRLALVLLSVLALIATAAVPLAEAAPTLASHGLVRTASHAGPAAGALPGAPSPHAMPLAPVPSVGAAGETDITPGCTVSNGSAPISVSGKTFTVTADFSGEILDACNGSTVLGGHHNITSVSGVSWVFYVFVTTNVTVQDLNLIDSSTSSGAVFEADASNHLTVTDVAASFGYYGFYLYDVVNATVNGLSTTASAYEYGVYLYLVTNLSILESNFTGVVYPIYAYLAQDIIIESTNCSFAYEGVYLEQVNNAWVLGDNLSDASEIGLYLYQDTNVWDIGNDYAYDYMAWESDYSVNVQSSDAWAPSVGDYGFYVDASTGVWISGAYAPYAGYEGVYAEYSSRVYLNDSNFSNPFDYGADLEYLSNSTVSHVNFTGAYYEGIELYEAANVLLEDLEITSMTYTYSEAIYFDGVTNARIVGGNLTGIYEALDLEYSQGVSVSGVNMSNSLYASGDTIYFYGDTGLSFENNLVLNAAEVGLYGEESTNVLVQGNNFTGDSYSEAVYLEYLTYVTVSGNSCYACAADGIDVYYSNYVTVTNNVVSMTSVSSEGIYLYEDIYAWESGNQVYSAYYGLDVEYTTDAVISNNLANNSYYALDIYADLNTTFVGNTVSGATLDFYADDGTGVAIYHNNFLYGGGYDLYDVSTQYAWDSGYPGGGNFWSNHTSPDTHRGPAQNVAGSDGIVDTPVVLSNYSSDRYPLTTRYIAHTITFEEMGLPAGAWWSVTINGTTVAGATASLVYTQAFSASGSVYGYSVGAVAGFQATPSSGTVAGSTTDLTESITFLPVGYNVTFSETGLAAATNWSVTLGNWSATGASASLLLTAPNGTFAYSIAPVVGYAVAPTHGTITVDGANVAVTVAFTAVTYALTFTESGLPAGTSWSVTVDGTPYTSTTSTISVAEANGSHAYSVGAVTSYTATPSSGTAAITGGAASVGVAFVASSSGTTSTSSSSTPGGAAGFWGLLVALLLAIVVAIIALVMWSRARGGPKSPPPAAAPWVEGSAGRTPPPASSPPPPGSSPPPGAV